MAGRTAVGREGRYDLVVYIGAVVVEIDHAANEESAVADWHRAAKGSHHLGTSSSDA
jgi:hypothetical protein